MQGIRNKKRSTWIREPIMLKYIIEVTKYQKMKWAGNIARREDNGG